MHCIKCTEIFDAAGRQPFNGHFFGTASVNRYRNISILDFVETKDDEDGGSSWS